VYSREKLYQISGLQIREKTSTHNLHNTQIGGFMIYDL